MNQELDKILAEIGREHRTTAAPEHLEAVLRAAAGERGERHVLKRKQAWAWAVALVLLAAIAVIGVDVHFRKSVGPEHPTTDARLTTPQPEKDAHPENATHPELSVQAESTTSASAKSIPSRRARVNNARAQDVAQKSVAGNSLQEFIPLPVSEGLPPATQLSVVRVKLQGSDLQQYGLEAPANALARSLMAEFVVGEDGLPRAIRILQ
jgi:hypothetical protein